MSISSFKPRVLHVDDSNDFLEIFSLRFKKNLEIFTARSGEEALEILRSNKIDAVVTDYDMPVMNGLELLKSIKEFLPDIPVILQTGQGNENVAREAFTLGASDYFTKDFYSFAHREKLINAINKAIEIKAKEEEKRKSDLKYRVLF